jgi:cytochrome b involved in lipid metabolism
MWGLFVGSFSTALIHNNNLDRVKNAGDVFLSSNSSLDNKQESISSIKKRLDVLHNTIHDSAIGLHYSAALESVSTVNSQLSVQPETVPLSDDTVTSDSLKEDVVGKKDVPWYELKTFVYGSGNIIYSSGVICGTICSVRYQKDSSTTLIASPGPGMIFSGWSGACTGVKKCTVRMSAIKEVTATFSPVTQSSVPVVAPTGGISEVDVTKHSTQSDCWIIVSGKVYSVSSYIAMHPGGRSAIITMCGKDATAAFTSRGGTGSHSSSARSLLGTFLVGDLVTSQKTISDTTTHIPSGYTFEQVAAHATQADCWIIVLDNVYSVSSYIALHPGGKANIITACGKDATSVFVTRDGTGAHTSYAWSLLGGYLIGSLATSIPATQPLLVTAPISSPTVTGTYTLSQVANHSSQSDCWVIISNNIYSVSSYIAMHPGGSTVIANLCGKDATAGFRTRGGTGSHSSTAYTLLGGFLIGSVSGTVPTSLSIPPSVPQTTTNPTITTGQTSTNGTYVASQVATHSSQSDCWIIVSNNIYSVSSYIAMHPGGAARITSLCGKDATTGFTTRGGTGAHSSYAWSLLGGYLIGSLGGGSSTPTPAPTPTPVPVPVTPSNPSASYTATQVATHSTRSDCWIIVSGSIYSVGSYISIHPGGTTRITNLCGKDATTGFTTRGGTGSHSGNAWSILGGFLIGTLSGSATVPTPTPIPTPTPVPTPAQPSNSTTYSVEVTSAGNYNVTSLNLHVGDKITISYVSPRTNEIKTSFTPSPPSTITLDKERTSKTVTFTSAGVYTFKAQDRNGNTVTVVVE